MVVLYSDLCLSEDAYVFCLLTPISSSFWSWRLKAIFKHYVLSEKSWTADIWFWFLLLPKCFCCSSRWGAPTASKEREECLMPFQWWLLITTGQLLVFFACGFSLLTKYLARSKFFSKICRACLDLRNPFWVSEHIREPLLNSVLINAESRGIYLFYVCKAYVSVMLIRLEGNKKYKLTRVLLNLLVFEVDTKRYTICLYNNCLAESK